MCKPQAWSLSFYKNCVSNITFSIKPVADFDFTVCKTNLGTLHNHESRKLLKLESFIYSFIYYCLQKSLNHSNQCLTSWYYPYKDHFKTRYRQLVLPHCHFIINKTNMICTSAVFQDILRVIVITSVFK